MCIITFKLIARILLSYYMPASISPGMHISQLQLVKKLVVVFLLYTSSVIVIVTWSIKYDIHMRNCIYR